MPRAWIDTTTHTPTFRHDVTTSEARELEQIMRQAFNTGLKHGYQQAQKRVSQTQS